MYFFVLFVEELMFLVVDCFEMVKRGVVYFKNVSVLLINDYFIFVVVFFVYFLKEKVLIE